MPDTARTVVITGASSGFGAAAVRAFADRGDRVWGTMRDADGRNAAKKADLEAYAPGIAIAEMDVTRDASVADGFAQMLASDEAPGKRPTRTVVGITWGVDEMNAFTQPRQDALLKEMQLDTVLGGADA